MTVTAKFREPFLQDIGVLGATPYWPSALATYKKEKELQVETPWCLCWDYLAAIFTCNFIKKTYELDVVEKTRMVRKSITAPDFPIWKNQDKLCFIFQINHQHATVKKALENLPLLNEAEETMGFTPTKIIPLSNFKKNLYPGTKTCAVEFSPQQWAATSLSFHLYKEILRRVFIKKHASLSALKNDFATIPTLYGHEKDRMIKLGFEFPKVLSETKFKSWTGYGPDQDYGHYTAGPLYLIKSWYWQKQPTFTTKESIKEARKNEIIALAMDFLA